MRSKKESTQNKINKRLEQAAEMSRIWEESDEMVQMYLKGCIATANALNGNSSKSTKQHKSQITNDT